MFTFFHLMQASYTLYHDPGYYKFHGMSPVPTQRNYDQLETA